MISAPGDWYKTFFTGLAVEMWLNAMPAEVTEREAAFLRAKLQVAPPAKLLDVPCGGGRHSIALASAGYQMTSVDLSTDFLAAARANAGVLPIQWYQRDMTDLPWREMFDGAFCFGNSFGYLPDADNPRFLGAVAAALKPGARFVLDYGVVLESVAIHFKGKGTYEIGDIHYERDGRYDPRTGRIIVEHSASRGGQTQKQVMSQRAYTYRELCEMLAAAGFTDIQGYNGFEGEPFTLGAQRPILVATKAPG